ncbi:protein ANTI-SILENCING 1 isoform X2 [Spinacia oleracea]|nr:protein ANTI-SILENCING 1 isoform X2 [Spinacia oleracea]
MAHYVFYRTFDVQHHTVTDVLGEKIAMTEVNLLLNKSDFLSLDLPMVDSANAVAGLENPLISHTYTLVEDGTMECDATGGELLEKVNKGDTILLDKSKYHPGGHIDAAGLDNTGLVVGRERKLVNKDPGGVDKDVVYDDSLGSLLSNDDKGSKGKSDAAVPDDLGLASVPATEVALASGSKRRLRSPESKENDLDEKYVVLPVTDAEKKISDHVKENHRAVGAVAKVKSDDSNDKPFKKVKINGSALVSSDNGGTSTPKSAAVASNKGSQSVVVGTDSNIGGRLTKEFDGISNGHPKKLKPVEKSDDRLREMSVKQPKDKQESAATDIAANKASQPGNDDVETDDKGNLSRKVASTSNGLPKKRKSSSTIDDKSNDKLRKTFVKEPKDKEIEAYGCVKEVTERPPDRSKWFTASPWEGRMKDAHDQGRLVLLHNLDPTYTSTEVENIVWHGFGESCTGKVVQRTATSSRCSGQAYVIFKTREVAEKVLKKLDNECFMLPNGRPLVGSRDVVCFPGKQSQFPGHLVIPKPQMQRESREAVSTSHSAQSNTLEYEMALEWRLLQERSELAWKMLYKQQGEQIKKLKATMKSE